MTARWITTVVAVLVVVAGLAVPAVAATPTIDDVQAPDTVEQGEEITVTVTLSGEGETDLQISVADYRTTSNVAVDGDRTISRQIVVDQEPGDYTVRVSTDSQVVTKEITVTETGSGPPPRLVEREVPAGQTTTVDVPTDVAGARMVVSGQHDPALNVDVVGVENGSLLFQTSEDGNSTLAVEAAVEPTIQVNVTPPADSVGEEYKMVWVAEAGDDQQNVGVRLLVVDSVSEPEPEPDPLDKYRTEDGVDIQKAVQDWATGELSLENLQILIQEWAKS